jgi:phosphoribosylamine--glycine ligase
LRKGLKVLVIGGGGREHALAWKVARSPWVSQVFCAPGNAGTALEPGVANVDTTPEGRPFRPADPGAALALARRLGADLTVVGPEAPLAAGIADVFSEAGLLVFGPTAAAARLESSKAFAKDFMVRHHIPTARFEVAETPAAALRAVARFGAPVVVKADGLAAGKGVTVARDREAAEAAVRAAMEEEVFGEAGRRVVVEECLEGREVSVLALTDGERVRLFPPAQDYKRVFDGDRGPNTGGMGAYCPAPVLGPEEEAFVVERVLLPAVRGLAAEGTPYRGVLYAGLMLTPEGPRVLEFNCRFGDPETQVILPLVEDDLVELMWAVASGEGLEGPGASAAAAAAATARSASLRVSVSGGAAVCVVMVSAGYPGPYETGKPISGLETAEAHPGVKVFHAGTRPAASGLPGVETAGGRVLNVVATAPTLAGAVERAYAAVALIGFEGAHHRSDIAAGALGARGPRPPTPEDTPE